MNEQRSTNRRNGNGFSFENSRPRHSIEQARRVEALGVDNQSSHRNYRDLKRNQELGLLGSASVLSSAFQMLSLSLSELALMS